MGSASDPLSLDAKVVRLVQSFERHNVPYAIGRAIALLYWGEPRSSVDIDVNVFLPASAGEEVAGALVDAGAQIEIGAFIRTVASVGQVRCEFDGSPVDLFFANVPFHESCAERAVRVPFGAITMNVLSAEDLVIHKAMFNRPKDWIDIEEVIAMQGSAFDRTYALRWLVDMVGPDAAQVRRLARFVAGAGGPSEQ